jgi:hypothetical protein
MGMAVENKSSSDGSSACSLWLRDLRRPLARIIQCGFKVFSRSETEAISEGTLQDPTKFVLSMAAILTSQFGGGVWYGALLLMRTG